MAMELQLRQFNFSSFSTISARLREDVDFESARVILGAYCVTWKEKVKEWVVKVRDLMMVDDSSSIAFPGITCVPETGRPTGVHGGTHQPSHLLACCRV